jgi:hypothetical protein
MTTLHCHLMTFDDTIRNFDIQIRKNIKDYFLNNVYYDYIKNDLNRIKKYKIPKFIRPPPNCAISGNYKNSLNMNLKQFKKISINYLNNMLIHKCYIQALLVFSNYDKIQIISEELPYIPVLHELCSYKVDIDLIKQYKLYGENIQSKPQGYITIC